MTTQRDVLERIAAALERLAPQAMSPVDWLGSPAFFWNGKVAKPLAEFDALPLDQLRQQTRVGPQPRRRDPHLCRAAGASRGAELQPQVRPH